MRDEIERRRWRRKGEKFSKKEIIIE